MNIVIWGTGANASEFIKKILPVCKDELGIKIVGILDDCETREGSYFHGFKVQHPSHLDPERDIDFVVQLETYGGLDSEKSKEILDESFSDKFVDLPGFCKIVNSEGFWRDKSVLFIGDRAEYDGYAYGAKYIFKHHEYYKDINEFDGEINRFDYIFTCGKWYTSNEQSVREFNVIKEKVQRRYKFDSNRIIDSITWSSFLHAGNCRINTKGDLNPDKKFLVLTFDKYCGWAIIQLFFIGQLTLAEKNGYIPVVDLQNFRTQYTSDEDIEKINIWNSYFEPVSEYSLEEVYNSKTVFLSGKRQEKNLHNEGRIVFNSKAKQLLEDKYEKVFPENKGKVLGVVYRGTDFRNAYNHPRPIEINMFLKGAKEYFDRIGYDYIYLATEVEDVVDLFKKSFGYKVFFIDQIRFPQNESRLLANIDNDREDDKHKKSLEYLTVLYLLTCCDSIYGIDCGATRYAKAFKSNYENYYTFMGPKNIPFGIKLHQFIKRVLRKMTRILEIGEYSR